MASERRLRHELRRVEAENAELRRPSAEVRRIRAELAELGRLIAEHLAADPGVVVTLECARRWARYAYDRGHADGVEAGRLAVLAEHKRIVHEIHDLWDERGPIWDMHIAALRRHE